MAALNRAWKLTPPLADSVAAIAVFLGAMKQPSGMKAQAGGSLADLVAEFGGVDGTKVDRRLGG